MGTEQTVPKFSVILPSFNGEDTLGLCLEALAKVNVPEGGAEFLFIDNRSTDATPQLLRSAAEAMGGVFLTEERPGKSSALNTAIAAAKGEYLVFTDDDVIVDPGWIDGYDAAIAAFPGIGVFVGQVRPYWSTPAPDWLQTLTDRGQVCGCTPAEQEAGPFPAWGAKGMNIMVRRDLFSKVSFDTGMVSLGASSLPTGGGDTKLMRDLQSVGEEIYYAPAAKLRHILLPHEMAVPFILKRQMRIGRGDAVAEINGPIRALSQIPRIVAYLLLAPILFLLGKRATAFRQILKAARRLGMLQSWLMGRLA